MKSINRLGTFEDVLASAPQDVRLICQALRALIEELHPDSVEVPRPGEPSVAYGFGEKKMSEAYAYIMPQKSYANLGFYHGASIADSHPTLEGTGARLRHIKIRSIEAVRSPATVKALQDSMVERRTALGLDKA
ncbi:hypothetical protein L107_07483 [Cyanobium sp. Copco_Reservoir_LC18]|uniref:DUF1801 domain-containing protein n=1 Tax=Cyanobium sp. Copco_Reservoir_LC18 TaxID=1328305 RepID=UPI001359425F|nr:DUF1801 domain-containing protein [Cyanobium sp. Copco_Reservoir_LC18]KAF0653416.1 hypothetical protein L107_07483 [Cyanobium sp. Copco_Reservoir_LC18]